MNNQAILIPPPFGGFIMQALKGASSSRAIDRPAILFLFALNGLFAGIFPGLCTWSFMTRPIARPDGR